MTTALEREAADGAPRKAVGRRVALLLLNLLCVAMLSASFAPWDCWFLAYVALAPWAVALGSDRSGRWAILTAWGAGLVFWLANLYWLTWITLLGYFLTAIFLSLYWLATAAIVRASIRRGWPTWLVLPAVWVALEYVRGYIISGFPWFYLAHSQYRRTPIIQIADLTGQYGVSFLVAMANGAIADLLGAKWFSAAPRVSAVPRSYVPNGTSRTQLLGPCPAESRTVPLGSGTVAPQDRDTQTAEPQDSSQPETRNRRRGLVGVVATATVAAAMLGYGWWRIGEPATSPGPVVGVIQQAYPIALTRRSPSWEDVLDTHLAAAGELAGTGCDLLLIPESMLPPGINVDFLTLDVAAVAPEYLAALTKKIYTPQVREEYTDRYLMEDFISRQRKQALKVGQMSRQLNCPILAGGIAMRPNPAPLGPGDYWLKFNSALWFDATASAPSAPISTSGPVTSVTRVSASSQSAQDGKPALTAAPHASTAPHGSSPHPLWMSAKGYYSKMHLVPFSEYVPFKSSWLALHRFLRSFVPEVMEQLEPGEGPLIYDLVRPVGSGPTGQAARSTEVPGPVAPARTWRLATPICYEGVFDYVCRDLVWRDGAKAADVLVNLSNDGWFVWQLGDGPFHLSTEHSQHLAQYCFRAVENRVPVVRAVNTGISASIDSTGAIVAQVGKDSHSGMIAGTLLLDGREGPGPGAVQHGPLVLVDRRWSVYSRVGDVFAMLVSAAAAALTVKLVWRRRGPKKERQLDAEE
jgi:apolipoprotein N-acyltransferase